MTRDGPASGQYILSREIVQRKKIRLSILQTYIRPAEKCSYRRIKAVICLKQKHWSKRWVLGTSNRCPDHLSRQFLTTASTFPYSSKNSSAKHIHTLSTWLIITNTLTHIDKHTHTHSHRQAHILTHIDKHTHSRTQTHTHTHSSAEHILGLSTWLTITNKLTHIDKHWHTHTHTHTHTHSDSHSQTHTHTHTHTHTDEITLTHTGICMRRREYVWLRNF